MLCFFSRNQHKVSPGRTSSAEGPFQRVCWGNRAWWTPVSETESHRQCDNRTAEQGSENSTNVQDESRLAELLKSRTLPGLMRSSTPVRSFFSSISFWKFSIFIMIPWSCNTISEMSARAAGGDRFIFIYRKKIHTWAERVGVGDCVPLQSLKSSCVGG